MFLERVFELLAAAFFTFTRWGKVGWGGCLTIVFSSWRSQLSILRKCLYSLSLSIYNSLCHGTSSRGW